MKKKVNSIFTLVLTLSLLIGLLAGTSSLAVELESNYYTPTEQQEIEATNQKIDNFIKNLGRLRSGGGKVLPMNVVRQENEHFCGPATACMVAKTLGLGTYTQSVMANKLGTSEDGSSSDQIASGLNKLLASSGKTGRYQRTNMNNSNLANSITYSINNNFPVVVNVKNMPNYVVSVGHFVAVNGYYAAFSGSNYVSTVTVCDPHPDYYGSYEYDMSQIEEACQTTRYQNFCRLA